MKLIHLLLVLVLMITPVLAAPPRAEFTFAALPTPIVYDVPFPVQLYVSSSNTNFIDYDLSVSSVMNRADFTQAQLSRADTFLQSALTGVQTGNSAYRVRTETNTNVFSSSGAKLLFTLNKVLVREKRESDSMVFTILEASPSIPRSITAAQSGVTFDISAQESAGFTPQLSTCGDGVVGYIESGTPDGIRQEASEPEEACDDGNTASGDGCSAQCTYVELEYYCNNVKFGDRGSVCTPLSPQEFLIRKLTALIQGQCYPDCAHPMAMYKADASLTPRITYDNEKIDASEKIYMLAQIGVALREFFSQTISTPAAPPATGS